MLRTRLTRSEAQQQLLLAGVRFLLGKFTRLSPFRDFSPREPLLGRLECELVRDWCAPVARPLTERCF